MDSTHKLLEDMRLEVLAIMPLVAEWNDEKAEKHWEAFNAKLKELKEKLKSTISEDAKYVDYVERDFSGDSLLIP